MESDVEYVKVGSGKSRSDAQAVVPATAVLMEVVTVVSPI
jgi:hypothetical protein